MTAYSVVFRCEVRSVNVTFAVFLACVPFHLTATTPEVQSDESTMAYRRSMCYPWKLLFHRGDQQLAISDGDNQFG